MLKDFANLENATPAEIISYVNDAYPDPKIKIAMINRLGSHFYEAGNIETAEDLFLQAFLMWKTHSDIDRPDIGTDLNNLDLLCQDQGLNPEAIPIHEKALEIARASPSEYHRTHDAQDKNKPADPDDERTKKIMDKLWAIKEELELSAVKKEIPVSSDIWNRSSPKRLTALNRAVIQDCESEIEVLDRKASHLFESGNYEKAEPLLKKALEMANATHGADHPFTGMRLNNLGGLYLEQGRYSAAESILNRALAIILMPLDSFALLGSCIPPLNNLGSLYQAQGRYAEAEPLFKKALEMAKATHGADHPFTRMRLNNLGMLYHDQGRYKEAEPLLKRALAITETAFGSGHPETGIHLNNCGLVHCSQGCYSEAEPLFLKALEIAQKFLGVDHLRTSFALNNLSSIYAYQSRQSEAKSGLKKSMEIVKNTLGADHPLTGKFLNNLGAAYLDQGCQTEAEPLLKKAMENAETTLGADHPETGGRLYNLGKLYYDKALYLEAASLFERISQTAQFELIHRVSAFAALARIAFKENAKESVNEFISNAWNLATQTKTDGSQLDPHTFNLATDEINCWNLLNNPFKRAEETSRRLRERLNLISEANRPYWAKDLHDQYTVFHVKWMQNILVDNEPNRIPFVLSLVSGWRVTQFILDEIDTTENISTLQAEVVEFKTWRLKISELRTQIQASRHLINEHNFGSLKFSPEGIHEQEERLKKLSIDYDNTENNMFYVQKKLAKNPEYAALATDIGIDITVLNKGLKPHQAIALCIDFSAHDFKGVLLVFSETGKTQWIDLSSFDTKDGLNRLDYFNRKFGGGRGFRRGDISYADTSSKANKEDVIEYSPEDFWPEFQSYLKQGFWDALGSSLEGIEELTLITQGNMHSLPLEMGAPQNLTLVRYPSITLYNMQQKIRDEKPATDANPVIGLACSNDNGIWFAKQEANAIAELYKNNSSKVIENYDFLTSQENITAAHLAGHGFHNDAHAHQAGLDMGGAELWTQPKLLSSKARPKRVFISACVAGKTTENSEGDVYGIAAAFMLRGTRELSAAIVNMNDPWMFLVGYRVEEYLLNNPTHSQYTALKHAKDDLVNQKPIPLVVLNKWKERVKDDLLSIINTSAPESDGRNQQLDEFIKFNTTLQIDEEKLRKDFLTVPRRDTNNPIANYEFTFRNIPPEPILGSLLYGILHFGK